MSTMSTMSTIAGLLGAIIGAIVTQIGNYILLEKKSSLEKKKIIFEQNLNILQEIKLNNLELILVYEKKAGLNVTVSNTTFIEEELADITSLATFSFRNLKLCNKLIDFEFNDVNELYKNVDDLHSKILEVQEAKYKLNSPVSLREEAKEIIKIIKIINKDIDTKITDMYS